ncbi:MAG: AAA family ATPase [Candidatus Aenigmatarchaeota archaeon]
MKFLVLGLTGKRGCGKDTMAEYLQKNYGFRILNFTNDVLGPILKEMGKEVTRENLIELALNLREKNGNDILAKMLSERIKENNCKGFWVISGIRYLEEVEYFKKTFGENFKLVKIECNIKKRYERIKNRGTKGEDSMSYKEFLEIEKRPTEKSIEKVMKLAEFSLDNNKKFEDFYRAIDDLMEKIKINLKG